MHRACIVLLLATLVPVARADLSDQLGRSETRVYAAPFHVAIGRTLREQRLVVRLERLDYTRVHGRPATPGTFFLGEREAWIYRRAHRAGGDDRPALLFAIELDASGRVTGFRTADRALDADDGAWLEPEVLSEALDEDRAPRVPVRITTLPEHVWRAVLAAEDHRFFEHGGVDGRAIARAMFANLRAGHTVQGASTITQQLVKNRDLGPQRTFGRKLSEAARALVLESEYDKQQILEAYLDLVYFGRVGTTGVYGLGAAAEAFFSKPARSLDLGEAALLAAIIRSPNGLSPLRHPQEARTRRDLVLRQMAELGWASERDVAEAIARAPRLREDAPDPPPARAFRSYVAAEARGAADAWIAAGHGIVAETALDLDLQREVETLAAAHVSRLRKEHARLRGADLSVAVVVLDASNGDVLAYVGGNPRDSDDRFDRARAARRQPGSAVKPFVLLEAFDGCGDQDPLNPATHVLDEPLEISLPSGAWRPENADHAWHGHVSLREALRRSDNVPFVRVARHCGMGALAHMFQRAGLGVPDDPPLSTALGALEVSPLELARAFTAFGSFSHGARDGGRVVDLRPVPRFERPSGSKIVRHKPSSTRVARASSAWLVRALMHDAVENGTGHAARIEGVDVAGKTGTTTDQRDAWFAGTAGDLVAVVWVGVDRQGTLGLAGGAAAAPLWHDVMTHALATRPPAPPEAPRGVVERRVDAGSGLVVSGWFDSGSYEEIFRRGAVPAHARFWNHDEPVLR